MIEYKSKDGPLKSMRKLHFLMLILLIFSSPAFSQQEISHTFYISANTGDSEENAAASIFSEINKASEKDDSAMLLLLGNMTRKEGFPEGAARKNSEDFLRKQLLEPISNFNGKVIFTPGVREWNKAAPQSIDDLESFLQDNSKAEVWPDDGCPLEEEVLNDEVVLITVDSQWFLEDWDDHPEMNLDCEIKDREQFFVEFKDDLKDNHGKTKIVAIHHPVMSNNNLGFINRTGGFFPQSFEHQKLQRLRSRLETLASLYDDVIFVSGSHRNLQFLDNERNPQIISGAAAKTEAARAKEDEHFASEKNGFVKLTIYKDGSSKADFYEVTTEGSQLLFSKNIERERPRLEDVTYEEQEDVGPTMLSSIYSKEETQKSKFHKWLLGNTNREIFSTEIEAPVLNIDTIPGNLRPLKEGGGQQSRSLRFIDDDAHEYTIRALRKSPKRYVQADLIKENYVGEFLDNTIVYRYLSDFFTTSHPYAPFGINGLYDALDIYHINPEIYYVPKQPALGIHNDEYGDELYMLEPHVGDENKDFETLGASNDILSTLDLLLEIREDKNVEVDENSFIKVRLFDLMVGDWDRHEDQWRWAEFEENGKKVYYPIPRDRDFAFPNYDGALMAFLKLSIPELRKMQSYTNEIKNLKWLTWSGYPLDHSFLKSSEWNDWEQQVQIIQEQMTDEVIESSFAELPKEVRDHSIEEIKSTLKYRRDNLLATARTYYDYLQEFNMVIGTEEDDDVAITRKENGITNINITTAGEEIFNKDYSSAETEEIWVYGLDGEDTFTTSGEGNDLIKMKVLGGAKNDTYDFTNTRKIKLYDYRSSENTILNSKSRKWLVDSYDINHYDYTKRKYHDFRILPYADFVPDAGFSLGVRNIFTTYGLVQNPFSTQHRLGANYYFATNGYEVNYSGEFAHVFYDWNFGIEARYTSPNYFLNYFGTGNDSQYDRNSVEKDFNRVKIRQWHIAPSLIWRNDAGGRFYFKPMIESLKIHSDGDDYVSQVFSPENDIFESQLYGGAEINYNYYNKNNASFPSRGMEFDVTSGYKTNIDGGDNSFGYIEPSLSFDYPLISSGFAVIATKIGGEAILGDEYEFYHGATLGGNNNLRGYRNHRFNGKRSFYHSTDLRSAFALLETEFLPIILGASVGFDYGRVWSENDLSDRWRNNYGGSIWINGLLALTGNIGFYHGDDGNRLTFTVNFKY
ncbi:hypothetical protein GCM10007103_31550 [Salinimicrobium marinum]|uniref:Bacterial surface antigen (D15) domain-containing protein n=2 Tax=Salinimicrobium marinum TaxID=680283 RepID=A0A918SL05_9FLAO|nr:hypothetical protein GCM10007103_31550 [Salinimicrobium marinum]